MGAFWEIFFLPVTIVSCNTLLIHYYTKILQTGHFVSQTSPQEKYLQKKWSIPQRSQWKLLQDGNKNNIWRRILRGVNSRTKWAFLGYIEKIPKNANIVKQFTPPECISESSLCFYLLAFSIGYIVVYSIFFLGAVLEEKFVKQNGRFEEFLYSNVLVKYYRIQWLLE